MFLLISILALSSIAAYFLFNRNRCLPKQFNNEKIENNGDGKIRDRFLAKKIPEDIDVIIIGSGLSGLTVAGLLSRVGKRVLVLESHYIAGGCTHAFEDKGYEFDTGLHYVGDIKRLNEVLDLITSETIQWEHMKTYDKVYIDDKKFEFKAGEDNLLKEIEMKFPTEIDNVKRYLKDVKRTSKNELYFISKVIKNRFISKLINLFNFRFKKSINESALDRIRKYIKNEELVNILLSQFGDIGLPPNKIPYFVQAGLTNHYLDGGYYPVGGSSVIAKRIASVIESTGGKILVNKKVNSILIDEETGRAIGVEMETGLRIHADKIVSACGAYNTYKNLLEDDCYNKTVRKNIIDKIQKTGLSTSAIYTFVGIKESKSKLNLESGNIWHLPNSNFNELLEKADENILENDIPVFIGFPGAKDSDWENRYPDKSSCTMITLTNFDFFEKWKKSKFNRRDKDYLEFKEKMIKILLKYHPELEDKIDYVKLGTPLTFNHYIGSNRGEIYGIGCNKERFSSNSWLNPKTHIEGLYLTGTDILTFGILGAAYSGVITANSVLGYGNIFDIIRNRNLIKDIENIS